jgi:hypothetical protein
MVPKGVLENGLRFLAGGIAGLFSAAPSTALATLLITLSHEGALFVAMEGRSMIVGTRTAGSCACCSKNSCCRHGPRECWRRSSMLAAASGRWRRNRPDELAPHIPEPKSHVGQSHGAAAMPHARVKRARLAPIAHDHGHKTRASLFLRQLARDNAELFVHWQLFGTTTFT